MHPLDRYSPEKGAGLADLGARARGSPLAARPLSAAARELPLAPEVRDFLAAVGDRLNLSVGAFLTDSRLHRDAFVWVRPHVLVRAFKRWFEKQGS